MADQFEKSGVELVVLKQKEAQRALDTFQKSVQGIEKTTDKAAAKTASAAKGFDISGVLSRVTGKIGIFNKATQGAVPGVGKLTTSLGSMEGAAAALPPQFIAGAIAIGGFIVAVGAAVVATKAFFALGQRGAQNEIIAQAFGNIVSGANTSNEVLASLRQQTRGTVSDLELMRLTTLALQGTTQTYRDVVAKDMGAVLDITKRVGEATGQGDIVREKFLLGLRRQSKLLLDDVGVAVDAEKAYRDYAEAIGVSAGALNDQQKQAAFAAEAIRQLKMVGEELGTPSGVLENLAKPLVLIQNTLDKLAIAIQPAFAPVAEVIGNITGKLENLINTVLPLVQTGAQILGAIFTQVFSVAGAAIDATIGPLLSLAGEVLPYVVAAAQLVGEALAAVINAVGGVVVQIFGTFASIRDRIFGDTAVSLDNLAFRLAEGGGRVIGSFAAGMLRGGTFVLRAVTAIARIVADFLQGFSPPKKGPLSEIDKGGENVAKAWAMGFAKGALESIGVVVERVNTRLGEIGSLSAVGVENRLKALDTALQPFVDNLDIAKSDMEAIAGFIDPALSIIERQQQAALKALSADGGDVEKVRQLDRQKEALQQLADAEQNRVDNAELQLSLAKAQQAQERALLAIQKKRVGEVQKISASSGAKGAAASALKAASGAAKGGGGGAGALEAAGGGVGIPTGAAPDLLANEAVARARAVLTGGFASGLEASGFDEALAAFEGQRGMLDEQLGRIADADPVASIQEKFSGFEEAIATPLQGIKELFNDIFGGDGAIATAINGLFGEKGVLSPQGPLASAITSIFGSEGIIASAFRNLFSEDGEFSILTPLRSIFGEEGFFAQAFGEGGTVRNIIADFVTFIEAQLGSIGDTFHSIFGAADGPVQQVKNLINNVVTEVQAVLAAFATDGVSGALSTLGAALSNAFIAPFVGAANSVLGALEGAINMALRALPGLLTDALGFSSVEIPRLTAGSFNVTGAAMGALGQKGLTLVGERGPELLNIKRPSNIFPADLTRAMLAQPQPVYGGGGGGNTYNQQRSTTVNQTYNGANQGDLDLRMRQMLAMS